MLDEMLERIQELRKKNEPFATAVVVRREAPSSGKAGDKAIINKYGEISGWVGGGCVLGILVKEAEDAMRTGKSRLVRIGQSINPLKQVDVMEYKMTCQSEGTIEIFLEPVMPAQHIVVMGKSAIAKSLIKLAGAMGYRITAAAEDVGPRTFEKVDELITQLNLSAVKTTPASFIVVATQGEGDERALSEALKKDRAYLGFVASKKKMASMAEYLKSAGFKKADINSINSPAGIDIHAKMPDEVAVSILAEMIQLQNTSPQKDSFKQFDQAKEDATQAPQYYINPVCGIPIDMKNPKHIVEYKGEKVYFCCDGCKVQFDANPEKYMKKKEATT